MVTFAEVSQKVLEKELKEHGNAENIELDDSEGTNKKRHRGYLNDIGEALEITNELYRLKENKKWNLTVKGAERLAELLFFYEKRTRGRKKPKVTKKLEKQMIKDGQYNAFSEGNIIELLEEYFLANELIIMCIECFADLFMEAGVSEEDTEEIMSAANRKFAYSKRKMYQESFKWIKKFLKYLETVNLERHGDITLSEKENAIWLESINKKINEDIDEAMNVRTRMQYIKEREMYKYIQELWLSDPFMLNIYCTYNKNLEEEILEECREDQDFMKKVERYKKITNKNLDLKKMIALVGVNLDKSEDVALSLVIRECVGVPADGNVLRYKGDDKNLEKLLRNLYLDIKRSMLNKGFLNLMTEKAQNIIRAEELFEEAKKKIEIKI